MALRGHEALAFRDFGLAGDDARLRKWLRGRHGLDRHVVVVNGVEAADGAGEQDERADARPQHDAKFDRRRIPAHIGYVLQRASAGSRDEMRRSRRSSQRRTGEPDADDGQQAGRTASDAGRRRDQISVVEASPTSTQRRPRAADRAHCELSPAVSARIGAAKTRMKAATASSRPRQTVALDEPDFLARQVAVPDHQHGHEIDVGDAEHGREQQTANIADGGIVFAAPGAKSRPGQRARPARRSRRWRRKTTT